MDEIRLKALIETLNFIKIEQSELENKVWEFYEKEIEGIRAKLLLQIEIQHYPEEFDKVSFWLYSNTNGTGHKIGLNINSIVDMTMLINIITKENE